MGIYPQPYSDNLTALDFTSTAYGRSLLTPVDAPAARILLGLGSADNPTFASLFIGGSDAKIARGATGPTIDLQAAGGIRSRNLAGSADAPISGSTVTLDGSALLKYLAGAVVLRTQDDSAYRGLVCAAASINGTLTNAGNVTPDVTNSRTNGTSSIRWSNTYSVLGNFSGIITAQTEVVLGTNASPPRVFSYNGNLTTTQDSAGQSLGFYTWNQSTVGHGFAFSGQALQQTTGSNSNVIISRNITPTSGSGTFAVAWINTTINQTGGANGITRGLYVNPTLTAAADFRGIEVSDCTGHTSLKTGTGSVSFGGNTSISGSLLINSFTNPGNTFNEQSGSGGTVANIFQRYGSGHAIAGGLLEARHLGGTTAVPTTPVAGTYINSLNFRTGGTNAAFSTNPSFSIRHTIGVVGATYSEVDTDFMVNSSASGTPRTALTLRGNSDAAIFPGTVTAQAGHRIGTASSNSPYLFGFSSNLVSTIDNAGRGVSLYTYNTSAGSYGTAITGDPFTATSGTSGNLYVSRAFTPTSGTGIWILADIRPTINQTGGASGITRGLYVAPTLTAAADFRALEISDVGASHFAIKTGTGKVDFGGTLTTSGSIATTAGLGVGTASPGAKVEISHTTSQMLRLNNPSTAADGVGGRLDGYNVLDYLAGIYMGFSGGTATANRSINFFSGGNSATPKMTLDGNGTLTVAALSSTTSGVVVTPSTYTNSSSVVYGLKVMPTYNQTGTAGSTDLLINRTDTALGSGTHLFADLQLAGTSRFSISKFGTVTSLGNIVFPGTAVTRQIQIGDTFNDGSVLQICNGPTVIGAFNAATGFITGLNVQASGALCAGGFTPATYGAAYKLQVSGSAVVQSQVATSGNIILNVVQGVSVTGSTQLIRAVGASSGSSEIYVQNTNNGQAKFYALVVGTGDAQSQYEVNGATTWSHGIDQSDSSAFVLSKSANLGTSNVFRVDASTLNTVFSSTLTWSPATSVTPASNGQLTVEATSNTTVTIKLKGSDGTVRSVALTLA